MQSRKKLAEAPKSKIPHKPSKASSQVSKASPQPSKVPSRPSNLQSRVHLLWLHSLPLLYRQIPLVVLREVAAYLSDPPLFVLLSQSFLSILDLSAEKPVPRTRIQLSERVRLGDPVYAVLGRTQLLCCGGNGTF